MTAAGVARLQLCLVSLLLAAASLVFASATPPFAAAASHGPRVTVLLVPSGSDLSGLDASQWSRGLLSAGMGKVPLAQTMLDIGQGARVQDGTYDRPLSGLVSVPVPEFLRIAARRAESAPREIVVGALRDALFEAGVGIRLPADQLARIGFSSPREYTRRSDASPGSSWFEVELAGLDQLGKWRRQMGPRDTVIALEMPDGAASLDIAVAGEGFTDALSSATTHLAPLVSSVDLAPTILERLGLEIPEPMEGTPMTGGHEVTFGSIRQAEDRLQRVRDRRWDLLLWGGLTVIGFFLVSGLIGRGRGLRFASAQTATGLPLAIALILVMGRLRLASAVELPLIFALASLGAWVLRRYLGDLRAYAAACGAAVLTVVVDLFVDLDLIPYSVLGSNPIGGVRFFGVGNELESIVAACLILGIASWGESQRNLSSRRLAGVYVGLAALTLLALVPGRFGADVGAMVTVAGGIGAACLLLLKRSWKLILAVLLALPALIAVFALFDTVTGGSSHFSRTLLGAESFGDAIDVLWSRLGKAAHTVVAPSYRPFLLLVAALAAGLAYASRRLGRPLRGSRIAVGLYSATAALVAGAAGNDSGLLLVLAGAPFVLSFWAMGLTMPDLPNAGEGSDAAESQGPAISARG